MKLKNKVKSSKKELLEVLNELLNYTPLVGVDREKYKYFIKKEEKNYENHIGSNFIGNSFTIISNS